MKNVKLFISKDSTYNLINEIVSNYFNKENKILYIVSCEQKGYDSYEKLKKYIADNKSKIDTNIKCEIQYIIITNDEIEFLKDINVLDEEFRDIIKNNIFVLDNYNNYNNKNNRNKDTDNLIKNIIDFSNKYNIEFLVGYNNKNNKIPKYILKYKDDIEIYN